jgi:hypothetical protein
VLEAGLRGLVAGSSLVVGAALGRRLLGFALAFFLSAEAA